MSNKEVRFFSICIQLLSGTFIVVTSIFFLTFAQTSRIESEQFTWAVCFLPAVLVCVLINLSMPIIQRTSVKDNDDLKHLLDAKSDWQLPAETTARVSMGKFIRVGSPRSAPTASQDSLEHLLASKKQSHWLPEQK